ncbi:MAG: PKD domain-containing protein [Bacteroidia bacterium]|nr:PKD domain-containing protein [Bacteroidia bacterium]
MLPFSSYQWSNGATTEFIDNLPSGIYSVTITDANFCIATNSINLQPPSVSAYFQIGSITNVSCYGGSDGTATVTADGGGPYSYSWSNGETTNPATNLSAGANTVTVTNAYSCTTTATANITQPNAVTPSIIGQNLRCNENQVAEIFLIEFEWLATSCYSASNILFEINGDTALYTEGAIGSCECEPGIRTATISDSSVLSLITNGINTFSVSFPEYLSWAIVTVYGVNTTEIIVANPSGLAETNGTDLCSNNYYNDTSVTVTKEISLLYTGSASLTVTGGTPSYTYWWSDASTSQNLLNISPGSYTVTVTDSHGCTGTDSVTITQPLTVVTADIISHTDVSCFLGNDGTATISGAGGTPPYIYLWDDSPPAQTTPTATSLSSGTYRAVVTDINGCFAYDTITITQPTRLTDTITSKINVACHDDSTGSATITAYGGTPPYTYVWNDPAPAQLTATATNLTAGIWTVTVTDANNCTVSAAVTVTQPSTPVTTNIAGTDLLCYGDTAVEIISIDFIWLATSCVLNPAYISFYINGSLALNTIGDNKSCYFWTATMSVTITDTSVIHLIVDGNNTFAVDFPEYLSWAMVTIHGITSQDIIIADYTGSPTGIFDPDTSITSTTSNVSLYYTGSANLTVLGGIQPYTYLWSGPNFFSSTLQDLTGISAGTYIVTVKDTNLCEVIDTIIITQPTLLTDTISTLINVSCYNYNDGIAVITPNGGTSPYEYLWNTTPPVQTFMASSLSTGDYRVTVTDSHNCYDLVFFTITEPPILTDSIVADSILCFGDSTGSIREFISGGTPPYDYVWSNGISTMDTTALSDTISGLADNIYTVTVTDGNGCYIISTDTITEPDSELIATIVSTDLVCNGNSAAEVISVEFSWSARSPGSPADITFNINGSPDIITEGANGSLSFLTYSYTVSEPSILQFIQDGNNIFRIDFGKQLKWVNVIIFYGMEIQNIPLFNSAPSLYVTDVDTPIISEVSLFYSGEVYLTVSGGSPPYSFLWDNGSTTQNLIDVSAGTYVVTVTDANSCTVIDSVIIIQPDLLTANIDLYSNVTCYNNGWAGVFTDGGTSPYEYSWNDSFEQTTDIADSLTPGSYRVIVTDAAGCQVSASVTIADSSQVSIIDTVVTNVSCNGWSDGSITITPMGVSPYTYNWSPAGYTGDSTDTYSGLPPGSYTVIVTDNAGSCTGAAITITEPLVLTANITGQINVDCYVDSTGSATVTAGGGTPPYTYDWSPNGYTGDGTVTYSDLASGNYTVTVTDSLGCTQTKTLTITQPSVPFSANITGANISCNGGTNGSATVTITSGGALPYDYQWSNGSSTVNTAAISNSIGNLTADTYSVTVTDNNNCTVTANITITEPADLVLTISKVDVTCTGANNGSVELTVTGGTSPYIYIWSNGETTEDIDNLAPGAYTCTVTDNNGCTATISETINEQPPTFTVGFTVTNVQCYGLSNGSATANPSGGTSPYTYSWNTFQTSQTASGLSAGVYSVSVSDAGGSCIVAPITVTQPNALWVIPSITNPLCYDGNDGTASVTVYDGTSPYIYSWSDGQTTSTATDLTAGVYSVTVQDNNGCEFLISATITNPPPSVSASISGTNITCYGWGNGTASVSHSGGTPPRTILWSTSQNFENLYNLSPGTYTVTVTDANGCTAIDSINITQPSELSFNTTVTNVACFNASTGVIDLTPSGGTSPYTYLWSNSATTEDISGLSAGIYSVTITDATSICTATASVSVTQPASMLTTGITGTDVTSNGGNDGSASLTVTGGISPYTYLWSNSATTQNISGLTDGIYDVTITDANTCTTVNTITINQPPVLSTSITGINVKCFGHSSGIADLSVSGGVPGYTYLWSNGATSQDLNNIPADTFYVEVTDANSVTVVASVIILEPVNITTGIISINLSCNGNSSGSIDLLVNGGTTPYTYSWNYGQSSQDLTNIPTGNYAVTITDIMGCTIDTSVTITEPVVLSVLTTQTNVSCFNGSNGSATVSPSGGTPGYTYSWTGDSTSQTISDKPPGTYTVTVTDSNNCTATATVIITEPPVISATITGTNVSCNNGSSGAVSLSVNGGVPPYTYIWTNGATTQNLSNITAGTYIVTITDTYNCSTSPFITIAQPQSLLASIAGTSVQCYGDVADTVNLTVTGGAPGYTYLWSNSLTSQDLTNLSAGTYSVTVFDANSCTTTASVTVTQPVNPLAAYIAGTNINCYGDTDGYINTTVTGGTSPYIYTWSNGASTDDLINITAGTYTATATDANGCTTTATVTITQPEEITIESDPTNVKCRNDSTGTVNLTVTGGIFPYSYLWNYGQTSEDIMNISAGNYSVTVTDFNSCTKTASVTVTQPASALTATTIVTNVLCYEQSTGTIDLTPSGGTPSYSYSWNNGTTSQDLNDLSSGTYTVTLTDANGCTISVTTTITQPASALTATTIVTNVLCYGQSTGIIDLTPSGGTPSYSYSWNNGATSQDLFNRPAGTYTVTITDVNGCTAIGSFAITQPASALSATTIMTNVNCNGYSTGSVDLTVSGGIPGYTYLWNTGAVSQDIFNRPAACYNNSTGSVVLTVSGGVPGYSYLWNTGDTLPDISGISAGTYTITVSDGNGCMDTILNIVTQPSSPVYITGSVTNVACYNYSTGSIDITVTGGTFPYFYLWSNNATSQDIGGIPAGIYSVTVSDAHSCYLIDSITVQQPSTALSAIISGSNITCYGQSTGAADLIVSGGIYPYLYAWSNGATYQDLNNIQAGVYIVFVQDNNSCAFLDTIVITEPEPIIVTLNGHNVTCYNGSDGAIDMSVTGGTGGYLYSWNCGFTTDSINNLTAGLFEVTISDANLCSSTASTIISEPGPLIDSLIGTEILCPGVCSGELIVILNEGVGTPPFNYYWSNSVATDSIATGLCSGIYSVTVADSNNCTDFATHTISVYYFDSIELDFTVDTAGCHPLSLQFQNLSTGQIAYYDWNFGDNSHSDSLNPTHTFYNDSYINDTSYFVSLTAISANLCTDTSYVEIIVHPKPFAQFTLNDTTACSHVDIEIYNQSIGATNYYWSFGDPTIDTITADTIVHTFENFQNNPVYFHIVLQASNEHNCLSAYGDTLIVYPEVKAEFVVEDSSGCSPFFVNITNNSTQGQSYFWNFSDGTSSNLFDVQHTYINSQTADTNFQISLLVQSQYNCNDATFQVITVHPTPHAEFTASPVSQNFPETTVTLDNQSTGGINYSWNFGDNTGSEQEDPYPYIYETWGKYYITLIVSNQSCSDSATIMITIIPPHPKADFDTVLPGCPPLSVTFKNLSKYANKYHWNFDDGAATDTATNPTYVFEMPGVYHVTLIAENTLLGESDTITRLVRVYEQPDAYFKAVPHTVKEIKEPVHFYNYSSYGYTYLWDFGDGSTSNEIEPVHFYQNQGIYDISLNVWSEYQCFDSITFKDAVRVVPDCIILFPNVFIPDKDGPSDGFYSESKYYTNNIFHPASSKIDEFNMMIFTRWGELIFQTNDIYQGWDGYYNGKLCQQDVYVWKAIWQCQDGQIYEEAGDVTLFH